MNKMVLVLLLLNSTFVCAESKFYYLNPAFDEMNIVEFSSKGGERGQTIQGYLADKNGVRYSMPDVCEPEGGDAELSDTYTVKGKRNYFLFTCAWPVQHSGIGLSGVQYETFIFAEKNLASLGKENELSRILSGYEGQLSGGSTSYAWYVSRKIASKKILEFEGGRSVDSLNLAHLIVLSRLRDGDVEAIRSYLDFGRVEKLFREFPVNNSTVAAYNDLGCALGQAGEEVMAYKILKAVEAASPDRVVLKLNIADVLWMSDKEKAIAYYKEYVNLMRASGKEKLVPVSVFEKITSY